MNRIKYLMFFILPMVFLAGCIDGQAVINLNKNGSGKVILEGLFDYAAYSKAKNLDAGKKESFFLGQLNKMITSDNFAAWRDVQWKLLAGGKCYFKGTAFFDDINQTSFYIGSINSNLKIVYSRENKPTIELKYSREDEISGQLLKNLNVRLAVTVPDKIEEKEDFQLLDSQTAITVIEGEKLAETSGKIVFGSDGNDLFNYNRQVERAQKETEKIYKSLEAYQEPSDANSTSQQPINFNIKMQQGLTAESQNRFKEALDIYNSVIKDPNATERLMAAANYQTGICLLKMGEREKAKKQFEYVIENYPLQRNALRAVKMLKDMQFADANKKKSEPNLIPAVIGTNPELYAEDVDPNLKSITISFSQPMKKTEWFYSSLKSAWAAEPNGSPVFDPCGVRWTLPVKLQPGKVYALAINHFEKDKKNLQAGFRSVSGHPCEKFILLFATANNEGEPTAIDDQIFEQCDKINFPK